MARAKSESSYEPKSPKAFSAAYNIGVSWFKRLLNLITLNQFADNREKDAEQAKRLFKEFHTDFYLLDSDSDSGSEEGQEQELSSVSSFLASIFYRKNARLIDLLSFITGPVVFLYITGRLIVQTLEDIAHYVFDFKNHPLRSTAFLIIGLLTGGLVAAPIAASLGAFTIPFLATAAVAVTAGLGAIGITVGVGAVSAAILATLVVGIPAALSLLNIAVSGIYNRFSRKGYNNEVVDILTPPASKGEGETSTPSAPEEENAAATTPSNSKGKRNSYTVANEILGGRESSSGLEDETEVVTKEKPLELVPENTQPTAPNVTEGEAAAVPETGNDNSGLGNPLPVSHGEEEPRYYSNNTPSAFNYPG